MPNNIRIVLASSVAAALAAAACHSRSTTSPESSQPAPAPAAPPAAPAPAAPPETVADEPAPPPAQGSASALALADFKGDRCSPEALVLRFGAMKPARPVTYLELRLTTNSGRHSASKAQQSFGTRCKGAPDRKTCAAALAAAKSEDSLFPVEVSGMSMDTLYLVAQFGAEVTTISTPTELRAFLGPIDTPAEAMLLALADGYEPLCTESKARAVPGGYEILAMKNHSSCVNQFHGHLLTVNDASIASLAELDMTDPDEGCAVAGRRPEGFRPPPRATADELLAYLDEMQALEAASIPAFLRLARELADHGAPAGLIARAEEAARDEVRHAAGFARLREALGAGPLADPMIPPPTATRSLAELALENAVEGCVRETFGALLAHYQAETATDGDLRQLLTTIAEDETRHAELAWDLRAWLDLRLDAVARARVLAAETAERLRLGAAVAIEPHPEVASRCGLPSARVAAVLHDRWVAGLWAA